MPEVIRDFRRWVWLVISGWLQYAEAGSTALIWVLVEKFRERPLSWRILGYIAIVFLVTACFNVWRNEVKAHSQTKQMVAQLQASPQSPLAIIFDPSNPARRFWSVESAKKEDGSLLANYWEHRVEIRNNGPCTLRNVGVTVERTGMMAIMPQDAAFVRGKQNMRDLKPGCSDHVPVSIWPITKRQPGMLAGDSAWEYGPVVITASADDVSPSIKTFDFNYETDQMLFERE